MRVATYDSPESGSTWANAGCRRYRGVFLAPYKSGRRQAQLIDDAHLSRQPRRAASQPPLAVAGAAAYTLCSMRMAGYGMRMACEVVLEEGV